MAGCRMASAPQRFQDIMVSTGETLPLSGGLTSVRGRCLSKTSFLIDRRNFSGSAGGVSARRDVQGPHRFTQKRPRTSLSVLQSLAAVKTWKKIRLSRDFRSSSIFDFFDSIGQTEKSGRATGKSALPSINDFTSQACQVRKVPTCQHQTSRAWLEMKETAN